MSDDRDIAARYLRSIASPEELELMAYAVWQRYGVSDEAGERARELFSLARGLTPEPSESELDNAATALGAISATVCEHDAAIVGLRRAFGNTENRMDELEDTLAARIEALEKGRLEP